MARKDRGLVPVELWFWLTGGRKRHARIVAHARELIELHGERARYVAIDFARLNPRRQAGRTAKTRPSGGGWPTR